MMYFTADLHYGHDNIVKYCNRPVLSAEEEAALKSGANFKISPETRVRHHNLIVNSINARVREEDTLWVIGDCVSRHLADEFRAAIRCRDLRLVRGNHDTPHIEGIFTQVHDIAHVWVGDGRHGKRWLTLCHYPMKSWFKSNRGSVMLHGHCHGNMAHEPNELILDVGVDPCLFTPLSTTDVLRFAKWPRYHWLLYLSALALGKVKTP